MRFSGEKAIYLQIADYYLENILLGRFKPDERVPSVRDSAAVMQATPNTALRAYNYLQAHEIIYKRVGVGYFVTKDGYEKTLALKRKDFVEQMLPEVFKMMDLLKINFKELEKFYLKRDFKER